MIVVGSDFVKPLLLEGDLYRFHLSYDETNVHLHNEMREYFEARNDLKVYVSDRGKDFDPKPAGAMRRLWNQTTVFYVRSLSECMIIKLSYNDVINALLKGTYDPTSADRVDWRLVA